MERFVRAGYPDTFRACCNEPGHYTWWSQRFGIRERNVGWRLDYCFINPEFEHRLRDAFIQPDVHGCDHCPVGIQLHSRVTRGSVPPLDSLDGITWVSGGVHRTGQQSA